MGCTDWLRKILPTDSGKRAGQICEKADDKRLSFAFFFTPNWNREMGFAISPQMR
jgi:hypothetical protein